MQASFSKLQDDSWGVFVKDLNCETDGLTGQEVVVERRNGTSDRVKLGEVTDRRSYGTQYRIARKAQAPQAPDHQKPALPEVADGRYAVNFGEYVGFYEVEHGKPGTRWDGFTFLTRESGDNHMPIKDYADKARVLGIIAMDPAGAAALYGREIGRCGFCNIKLTDDLSRAVGIGPQCAKDRGINRQALLAAHSAAA